MMLVCLSFIVLLIFLPETHHRRIQEFILYSTVGDGTENFTENVSDLDFTSTIVKNNQLQSVCSQLGLWAFFTGKNYTTVNSYGYHPATPGWTCQTRRIMADWKSPFRSIRHVGHTDLDIPALSLFGAPFFASEELYIYGHELSLPNQIEFGSFGFTGRQSWTVYSDSGFSGESVCLLCKCDLTGVEIGVTYTAKLSISAASIRRGCYGSQVLLPTGVLENRTAIDEEKPKQKDGIQLTLSDSVSNRTIEFSGTELRLPCCYEFDQFHISRKSNWTIFSGVDLSDPSMCLVYNGEETESSVGGATQHFAKMSVGSIRFGCIPSNTGKMEIVTATKQIGHNTPISSTSQNIPGSGSSTSQNIPGSGSSTSQNIPGSSSSTSQNIPGSPTEKNIPSSPTEQNIPGSPIEQNIPLSPPRRIDEFFRNSTTPQRINSKSRNFNSSRQGTGRGINLNDTENFVSPRIRTPNQSFPSIETTIIPLGVVPDSIDIHDLGGDSGTLGQVVYFNSSNHNGGKEIEVKEPAVKILQGNVLGSIQHPTDHGKIPDHKPMSEVEESGRSNMFFTAFLIILGILVGAMVVTICVFIYLRASRSTETDTTE